MPAASTPLWQLAQLVVTPAWDGMAASVAAVAAVVARDRRGRLPSGEAAASRGAFTTLLMVLRVVAARFSSPRRPPQLLGLWQPLQSWPTWWSFGRVVKLVTP